MNQAAYTDKKVKKIKELELNILMAIDKVCRNNNLQYFIGYGTALGQRRHGGFIPWDDDIDIHMVREDYERFLSLAQKQLGDEFFVQDYHTDPETIWLYAKVRLNGTVYVEWQNSEGRMHKGIYVDIFPLDKVPESAAEMKRIAMKFQRMHKLYSWRITGRLNAEPESGRDRFRGLIKEIVHRILCFFPRSAFYHKYERMLEKYKCSTRTYGFWLEHRFYTWDEDVLFPIRKDSFEGKEVNVVNDAEQYLEILYGDWRQLPPEKERAGHKPYRVSLGRYAD